MREAEIKRIRDLAVLDELIAAEEKRLLEAREKAREVYPIAFFRPNPAQYRMFLAITDRVEWLADGGARMQKTEFGFLLGNGVGKTWAMVWLTGNMVWGPQSPLTECRLFREWPFKKHVRWCCTADELKPGGELYTAIEKWWPRHKYRAEKLSKDYLSIFTFFGDDGQPNGWTLTVRTFEQQPREHESVGIGCAMFNEPPPKNIWDAYPARFREGGFRVLFGTPVIESVWIANDLLSSPTAFCMHADIEENCREHARLETPHGVLTGHLSHTAIEQMIAAYPEHEREARRTGVPVSLRGRAFDVEPTVHFIPRSRIPSDTETTLVLDPHLRRPWTIIIGAVDKHGRHYIVDEWPRVEDANGRLYHKIDRWDWGIQQYVHLIRKLEQKWNVQTMIIDGKFSRTPHAGDYHATNLRLELERHGLWFYDGDPRVEGEGGGTNKLKTMLAYDKSRPVDFLNQPMLLIADDLANCRFQLTNISWDDYADPNRYGRKEKLKDDLLDYPRCMMYLIMHNTSSHDTPPNNCTERRQRRLDSILAGDDETSIR